MNWWHAVILGLVEGITEYLPVSSTGHLIITSAALGLTGPKSKDAIDAFEIVIQGGAILAVVGLYWPRYVQMLRGLVGRDPAGFRLFVNIVIAFIPAAVVGVVVKKWVNTHLFHPGPVIAALIVGGVYMIIIEQWRAGRFSRPVFEGAGKAVDDLTFLGALTIGCAQVLSIFPGTSRSMMTITGGYFARLKPAAAAEFSFLLGVPTLLGATLKAAYDDIKESRAAGSAPFYLVLGPAPVVIGMIVAALSAAFAVRWLVGFLNRHGLSVFGYYRIFLGVALTGLVMGKVFTIEPPGPPAAVPAHHVEPSRPAGR